MAFFGSQPCSPRNSSAHVSVKVFVSVFVYLIIVRYKCCCFLLENELHLFLIVRYCACFVLTTCKNCLNAISHVLVDGFCTCIVKYRIDQPMGGVVKDGYSHIKYLKSGYSFSESMYIEKTEEDKNK